MTSETDEFWSYFPKTEAARKLKEFRSRAIKSYRVEDTEWNYYSGGSGNKCIIFLHGMGGAYDIWWQQILHFEKKYRIISPTYPMACTLDALARGVISIAKKENVDRFIAVGSSLGGYLAQYLVTYHGEKIEKAVFGNTFPPNKLFRKENRFRAPLLRLLPDKKIREFMKKEMLTKVVPASGNSPLLKGYVIEMCDKSMSKALTLCRYRCVIEQFAPCDGLCKVPLMLIESDNDPMIPPELRKKLRRLYRFSAVHTFHNAGHFPYVCRAEEYNRVLEEFITM